MHKRTKLLQFDKKIAMKIAERDKRCIFCSMGYHMDSKSTFDYQIPDIMHVVNKSQKGLGIERNGVLGCRYHHSLLDNGNQGLRDEMIEILKDYIKSEYPGWTEEDVVHNKWKDFKFS